MICQGKGSDASQHNPVTNTTITIQNVPDQGQTIQKSLLCTI